MRPVLRGSSPRSSDYKNYQDAKLDLVSRIGSSKFNGRQLGSYCSYCERVINTNLAVEHIEPKDGDHGKPQLIGTWTNYLLACVNCNSTKSKKEVDFSKLFFPDRDNTFAAFTYSADGNVTPSDSCSRSSLKDSIANATLSLVGLDKKSSQTKDANGNIIALDRVNQRIQIWGIAEDSLGEYKNNKDNQAVVNGIVRAMCANGFFSVWMTVFEEFPEMRNRFIDVMKGTRESGCFDPITTAPISPHPNADQLEHGSKI